MALDNSKNWTSESKENIDKQKIKKQINKAKFIKDFIETSVSTDKVSFLNDLEKNEDINWDLKKSLKSFMEAWSNESMLAWNPYEWLSLNDINISDLKNASKKYLIPLNIKRSNVEKIFSDNYELDASDKKYISKLIYNQKEEALNTLLTSQAKRIEFLKNNFDSKKVPVEKDLSNFLSDYFLKNKLDLSNKDLVDDLENINFKISKWYKIEINDVKRLLNNINFDLEEKKKVIHQFIPTITLKEAVDLNIKDYKEALDYKKKLALALWFGENEAEYLANSMKNEDIVLSTKLHVGLNYQIDEIVKNADFSSLVNDFNFLIDEVKEEIKNSGPQTIGQLVQQLGKINKNSKFINLEKFSEWNIIEIEKIKKDNDGKKVFQKEYVKIIKTDDENKKIVFAYIWKEEWINKKLAWSTTNDISYVEFLDKFSWENTSLNFFTEKEIDEKVSDPNNKDFIASDLEILSQEDLNQDNELKEKYKADYKTKLEKDLEDLNQQLEQAWWKKEENPLLSARIEDIEEKLKTLEKDLNDNEFLDFVNLERLLEKLDSIDEKGKNLWLKKWLFIETTKWSYEVIWVWDWVVSLKSVASADIEELDYLSFYEAFKSNEAHRVEKIKDFWELIKSFDWEKAWENCDFKDGEFIKKDVDKGDKKWDQEIEYFTSWKSDELLKIESISGDKVKVTRWERKWVSSLDKKDKHYKKDWTWEVIYLEDKSYTLTLNELKKYLKDNKLEPNWETGKTIAERKPDDLHNKFRGSFATRLFSQRISISEMIAWGKMFVEGITETVKRWNDLHAARVALAMWSMLPEEIRSELQIKVERQEAEEMDKALDWLWKVDSPIATKRIREWLLNKDTAEYKKEAWMLFMLSKYGHLTAKWPLYEFRGKWLWYEAFWWKVNDKLFLEIKDECEKWGIPFTEEYLLHILLKRQCKHEWYNSIKRRSRLHKEYENKWKSGIDEELDKWYKDASNKRTAESMVKWGMGEALWWTTSNAIWWFKKAIERWWSLEEMNEWFFSLLYSWALYDIEQKSLVAIKDLWGAWMPIILTRFSSTVPDMLLFNKTVLELSNKIWDAYPDKFKNIKKDAQDLFDDASSWKWEEKNRLERAKKFWKDYWKPLSRALYMSDTNDTTYSKTDKIVALEKDNKDSVLSSYFKRVRDFTDESDFKKDYMNDMCWAEWVSWLDNLSVIKLHMKLGQNRSFYDDKTWLNMWNKIYGDIIATKDRVFIWNDLENSENVDFQRKYLTFKFRELFGWFRTNHSWETLKSYNDTIWVWKALKSWWVNMYDNFKDIDASDILSWESSKSEEVINKVIDRILSWEIHNDNYNPFDDIESSTKDKVEKTTKK